MQRFADELVLAKQDLDASMRLDPRPYLSVLQLMKIARAMGDDAAEDAMLAYGDRVFPHDPRIHRAHFVSLEPRWGGSYEKMDAYRQTMRRGDREDRKFALQLDALEEQDKGNAQWNDNDEVAAQRHFAKALEIGARVGGCFATEYLGIALDFKKRGLPSPKPSVESSRRFHALGAELARSLDEHRYADAASLAEEYLKLAQENSLDPQHDIAVHDANAALGIVALDRGEGDKALGYLMKAVSAFDVSDRLAFPPSLELPNRLLARRYRSQVLMYLDTLSRVWRNDHGLYASWHARIQRGELPDLQAEAGQKSSR
jgi:tetratricopeptide (TPR) repeat protein